MSNYLFQLEANVTDQFQKEKTGKEKPEMKIHHERRWCN